MSDDFNADSTGYFQGSKVEQDKPYSELLTEVSPVKVQGLSEVEQYLLGINLDHNHWGGSHLVNYIDPETGKRAGICRIPTMNVIIGYAANNQVEQVTVRFNSDPASGYVYNALMIKYDRDLDTQKISGVNLTGFFNTYENSILPDSQLREYYDTYDSVHNIFILFGTLAALEIEGDEISKDMNLKVYLGGSLITTLTIKE